MSIMSNYPNMSYCMFGNTVSAMNQILEEIEEANNNDGAADFFNSLSREERRNLQHLYNQAEQYIRVIEDMWDLADDLSEDE